MENFWELFKWWNLIFLLPFTTGLLYLVLMQIGIGATEHDHDIDLEHDISIGHDGDLGLQGHDHDVGHDTEGDTDHDTESDVPSHEMNPLARIIGFFGLGRVPISILFISFCFIWGFCGWVGNQIFSEILLFPAIYIWPSLGLAIVVSLFCTRWIALVVSYFMPTTETYVIAYPQMVGKKALAITIINEKFGIARFQDHSGTFYDLNCKVRPDDTPIRKNNQVVLLAYSKEDNMFTVCKDPL